jgi:hypothetical protein
MGLPPRRKYLRRFDLGEEAVDFGAQHFRLLDEPQCRGANLLGGTAAFLGGGGNGDDVGGDLSSAGCGLLDVAGDLAGRRALLFYRRGDRIGNAGDALDDLADAARIVSTASRVDP